MEWRRVRPSYQPGADRTIRVVHDCEAGSRCENQTHPQRANVDGKEAVVESTRLVRHAGSARGLGRLGLCNGRGHWRMEVAAQKQLPDAERPHPDGWRHYVLWRYGKQLLRGGHEQR